MELVSDHVLEEVEQTEPTFPAHYPRLDTSTLTNPWAFTQGQPFDLYKTLREQAPVVWTPFPAKVRGFWAITRYEDIKTVEVNPDIYSSERGSINLALPPRRMRFPKKLMPAAMNSLINLDAPRHMEVKLQQKDFFIPKYVATLKEKVAGRIDQLLDAMDAAGPEVDFVKMFSEQLPLFTLCEMLGVDEDDRPKVVRWMHYLEQAQKVTAAPLATLLRNPLLIPRYIRYVNEMFDYGERVMADRRANPRDDLLTAIAHSTIGNELMPQEFLDGSWLLIIFAGNDTTRNSLSGTMRLLTEFPDQKNLALEDRSLIPNMAQEILRMVSPVMHMRRTAMCETELNGQKIAKDEKLALWYGAANRDPDVFPDPDRFDILRDNADKHLAFGHGPHKCLGSRIAIMQLQLAYEKILDRFPNITWTGQQTIAPNNFVHAVSSLKVRLNGT